MIDLLLMTENTFDYILKAIAPCIDMICDDLLKYMIA